MTFAARHLGEEGKLIQPIKLFFKFTRLSTILTRSLCPLSPHMIRSLKNTILFSGVANGQFSLIQGGHTIWTVVWLKTTPWSRSYEPSVAPEAVAKEHMGDVDMSMIDNCHNHTIQQVLPLTIFFSICLL